MSLKFNYNSNNYIFIPITRTADIETYDAIALRHTLDTEYQIEMDTRVDEYPLTANHITYSEALNLTNCDGTETFISVVRHPMDRCVSLYNYMRSQGWVSDTNFNTYWTDVINNKNHDSVVSPGARTSTLQSNIVKPDGTIYKFETDLTALASDFDLDLDTESEPTNVVEDSDKEAVRSLIESYFDADYTAFGYDKG